VLRAATATLPEGIPAARSHAVVELREGKNREVRRLFAAVGHEVDAPLARPTRYTRSRGTAAWGVARAVACGSGGGVRSYDRTDGILRARRHRHGSAAVANEPIFRIASSGTSGHIFPGWEAWQASYDDLETKIGRLCGAARHAGAGCRRVARRLPTVRHDRPVGVQGLVFRFP